MIMDSVIHLSLPPVSAPGRKVIKPVSLLFHYVCVLWIGIAISDKFKDEVTWKSGNIEEPCILVNNFKIGMCFLDDLYGSVSKIKNSS